MAPLEKTLIPARQLVYSITTAVYEPLRLSHQMLRMQVSQREMVLRADALQLTQALSSLVLSVSRRCGDATSILLTFGPFEDRLQIVIRGDREIAEKDPPLRYPPPTAGDTSTIDDVWSSQLTVEAHGGYVIDEIASLAGYGFAIELPLEPSGEAVRFRQYSALAG